MGNWRDYFNSYEEYKAYVANSGRDDVIINGNSYYDFTSNGQNAVDYWYGRGLNR